LIYLPLTALRDCQQIDMRESVDRAYRAPTVTGQQRRFTQMIADQRLP
jgi:hypothetical protein